MVRAIDSGGKVPHQSIQPKRELIFGSERATKFAQDHLKKIPTQQQGARPLRGRTEKGKNTTVNRIAHKILSGHSKKI
jgi:hypothetical protein